MQLIFSIIRNVGIGMIEVASNRRMSGSPFEKDFSSCFLTRYLPSTRCLLGRNNEKCKAQHENTCIIDNSEMTALISFQLVEGSQGPSSLTCAVYTKVMRTAACHPDRSRKAKWKGNDCALTIVFVQSSTTDRMNTNEYLQQSTSRGESNVVNG